MVAPATEDVLQAAKRSVLGCRNFQAAAPASAATTLDLELPKYNLVNLSAGMDFGRGLSAVVYVKNLTDEKALLSFDRERGGRARLGFATNQPRTIGVTVRKTF